MCRSFGTYESELWDDVFSEFEPITSDDIILVNFAAWYPKYKITEPYIPYEQWEEDMAGDFAAHTMQQNPLCSMQSTGGGSSGYSTIMPASLWSESVADLALGWELQILLCQPPATTV